MTKRVVRSTRVANADGRWGGETGAQAEANARQAGTTEEDAAVNQGNLMTSETEREAIGEAQQAAIAQTITQLRVFTGISG